MADYQCIILGTKSERLRHSQQEADEQKPRRACARSDQPGTVTSNPDVVWEHTSLGCMEKRFVLGDLRSLCCRSLCTGAVLCRQSTCKNKNKRRKARIGKSTSTSTSFRPTVARAPEQRGERKKRRVNKEGQDLPCPPLCTLSQTGRPSCPGGRLATQRTARPETFPTCSCDRLGMRLVPKGRDQLGKVQYLQQLGSLGCRDSQGADALQPHPIPRSRLGAAAIIQGVHRITYLSIMYPDTCIVPAGQQKGVNHKLETQVRR